VDRRRLRNQDASLPPEGASIEAEVLPSLLAQAGSSIASGADDCIDLSAYIFAYNDLCTAIPPTSRYCRRFPKGRR
jgi:hypothetical protein